MPDRRAWSVEQDKILKQLRQQKKITKWSVIAHIMADQYNIPDRTGKQCRERYRNHLDSTILKTEWSNDEDQDLYQLHDEIGNKWAIIAQKLPGRTDNCVKNHFYSKMRKSIRKLNKIIYQYFKKQIKEIKMNVLYKIIEATDQRFKTNPNVQIQISDKCNKLKNILLIYSNDNNAIENDIEQLAKIARQIHEFNSKYRKKTKKTRRPSVQGGEGIKYPKYQTKVKIASDIEDEQSEYSMVVSHECEDGSDEDSVINTLQKSNLEEIKQELKESTNSKFQLQQPVIQIKPQLIKPPTIINPLSSLNKTRAFVQETEKVEQFLRTQGILQNSFEFEGSLKFSGAFKHVGMRVPSLKVDESGSLDEEMGSGGAHGHNFLNESIEKMRISDLNFDVEVDEQNKLFISN